MINLHHTLIPPLSTTLPHPANYAKIPDTCTALYSAEYILPYNMDLSSNKIELIEESHFE